MGEAIYPLSFSYGSKPYLLCYFPLYKFTPQTCPIRWCAHLRGCRWGVRGFKPDLRPSEAVDRRRTLYNTEVHCFYDIHYLIHTHHTCPIKRPGGALVQELGGLPLLHHTSSTTWVYKFQKIPKFPTTPNGQKTGGREASPSFKATPDTGRGWRLSVV